MNAITLQTARIDRLKPGGGAEAFTLSGIGVAPSPEGFAVAIFHASDVALVAHLDDAALDRFAASLALAVSEKTNADLGLPRILPGYSYPAERKVRALIRTAGWMQGLAVEAITGPSREKEAVRARDAVIWAARRTTPASWPQLGRTLNRDHTTIIAAERRAKGVREADLDFRRLTDALVGDLPANDEETAP